MIAFAHVPHQDVATAAFDISVLEDGLEAPFTGEAMARGFILPVGLVTGLLLLLPAAFDGSIPQLEPSSVASPIMTPMLLPCGQPFFVPIPVSPSVERWVLPWLIPPVVLSGMQRV